MVKWDFFRKKQKQYQKLFFGVVPAEGLTQVKAIKALVGPPVSVVALKSKIYFSTIVPPHLVASLRSLGGPHAAN
jgi:hypothetical protein